MSILMSDEKGRARYDTLHINLWGIPGVRKSAVGGVLYGKLKEAGYQAVLIHDYAQELALQGRLAWRDEGTGEMREYDQFLISSEQYRRQSDMDGLVEVVVTDSPMLQQIVFAPEHYSQELRHVLNQLTIGWTNLDVLLERDIHSDYRSMGRIQTADESTALYPEILTILKKNRPEFMIMATEGAEKALFDIAVDKLQRKRNYRSTL